MIWRWVQQSVIESNAVKIWLSFIVGSQFRDSSKDSVSSAENGAYSCCCVKISPSKYHEIDFAIDCPVYEQYDNQILVRLLYSFQNNYTYFV